MMTAFNTDFNFLAQRLFQPIYRRIGAITHLNINVLPDFVMYLKNQLTSQQVLVIEDYQLQTYLLELSLQKTNGNLSQLTQKILTHIRNRDQFWQKNRKKIDQNQEKIHQHQAITQYEKDILNIKNFQGNQQQQKQFKILRIRKCFQRIIFGNQSQLTENYLTIKYNFNNFSLITSFLVRKLNFCITQIYQSEKENLILLNLIRKKLQKGVEHFVTCPKMNIKQIRQPTRELSRNRPLQNLKKQIIQQEKQKQNDEMLQQQQQQWCQNLQYKRQQKQVITTIKHQCNQIQSQESDQEKGSQIPIGQSQLYEQFQNWLKQLSYFVFQQKQKQKQSSSNTNTYLTSMYLSDLKSIRSSKQHQINLTHNILEVLRCAVFIEVKKDTQWFQLKEKQYVKSVIQNQIQKKLKDQKDQKDQKDEGQSIIDQSQNQLKSKSEIQVSDSNQKSQSEKPIEQCNKNAENKKLIKVEKIETQKNQQCQDNMFIQKQPKAKSDNNSQQNMKYNKKKFKYTLEDFLQFKLSIQNSNHKDHTKTNNQILSYSYSHLLQALQQRLLKFKQIYFVAKSYLDKTYEQQIKVQKKIFKIENQSKLIRTTASTYQMQPQFQHYGFLTSPQDLQKIRLEFNQMIQHPQNIKLAKFKTVGNIIPWQQEDYLNFLRGFNQYFYVPTNNKKIATFMSKKGNQIEANHVKHIKSIYMKNMQIRIDKGEIGGGKRGKTLVKTQFVKNDIENFQMKYFEKLKKSKKKRSRRSDSDQQDQIQVDSQY